MTVEQTLTPPPDDRVDARPSKKFFVQMLVRDIELAPAIIDLLDNAIDGAKRLRQSETSDQFKDLWVRISVGENGFSIQDNCGGMSSRIAKSYAFRFGRLEDMESTPGEVGQFGVGMKRALFKIGKSFDVASMCDDERFRIKVDVVDWLRKPDDWSFPFEELPNDLPPSEPGTMISVSNLHPSVASDFELGTFLGRLRSQIAMRHAVAMERSIAITLNDEPVTPRAPVLLVGGEIKPVVRSMPIKVEDGEVQLDLYAGFTSLEDENADTDDPEQFKGSSSDSGWYLFCNDRMLLWADQSRLTGWGEEVARYHPQYRRFRGYAMLKGEARFMPWNTAKTTVDEDSLVWRAVRKEMVDVLRDAIKNMNRFKREVEQRPPDDRPLVHALSEAKAVRLTDLEGEISKLGVPPVPPKISADTKAIRYAVPNELFERVAEALDVDSPTEVGRKTFDYFVAREIDD